MSRAKSGFIAIAAGAVGGQALGLAAAPVISRIYGPTVFGEFAIIQSLAAVLVPIATLRIESALLLPRETAKVKTLVTAGLVSSLVVAAGFCILLAVVGWSGLVESHATTPTGAAWVGALTCVTGVFTILSQAALRSFQYKLVAVRNVVQQGSTAVAQIGLGLLAASSHIGLTLGRTLGVVASTAPLIRAVMPEFRGHPRAPFFTTLREYREYPLVFAPSALLNSLGTQLPVLGLAMIFDAGAAGQLGMAQRIALVPSALIGYAISQVFAAEASEKIRNKEEGLERQFLTLSVRLGLLGLIVGSSLYLLGPVLFPWFLGDQWAQSGEFARLMALSVGFGIVASPLSMVFVLMKAALASVCLDVSRVLLILTSLWLGTELNLEPEDLVLLVFSSQAVNYLATYLWSLRLVNRWELSL